jgi:hypothetical protein
VVCWELLNLSRLLIGGVVGLVATHSAVVRWCVGHPDPAAGCCSVVCWDCASMEGCCSVVCWAAEVTLRLLIGGVLGWGGFFRLFIGGVLG